MEPRSRSARARNVLGALLACACVTSCDSIPFPEKPKVYFTPVYAALEMDGHAKLESGTLMSGKTTNKTVDLQRSLNVADRDTAVGATLGVGDGFGGVEFGFLRWEQRAFDTNGKLEHDFGDLLAGDAVESDILYQQWRLEFLAEVHELELFNKGTARFGVGAGIHHNNMRFEATTVGVTPARAQNLSMKDAGMPVLRARAEGEWKRFRGRVDVGYSTGHWKNIDGNVLDLQLTARFEVARDIALFAGWKQYDLPFEGGRDDRDYQFDADLTGWIFGLEMRF